jgi:hypothetical protein
MKNTENEKNMKKSGRMQREGDTVEVMIRHYCRRNHSGDKELCADCAELINYAEQRLANCPFQEGKTTCGNCQVHCYKPSMREKIRQVMRAIGPRMVLTNPLMTLHHALDGLRKEPIKKESTEE